MTTEKYGVGKRYEVRILSGGCWSIFKSFDNERDAMACRDEVIVFDVRKRRVQVWDSATGVPR